MLPGYKKHATIGVGTGILFHAAAVVTPDTGEIWIEVLRALLWAVGVGSFTWGLVAYAMGKGCHGAWGLLGVMSIFGLLVLVLLRDKHWELKLQDLDDASSNEPTTKPVVPADVAGEWQFYLDSVGSTVIVDFRLDGTFSQRILHNAGGMTDCEGGTWQLEGAKVHLANYVSARSGQQERHTWWMIDGPSGLAMIGGEGEGPGSRLRVSRRGPGRT